MHCWQKRVRWGALAVLLLLCPAARAAEDDVGALVDAVVEAYGGAEALAKLGAFRTEGEVDALSRGQTGTLQRDFVAPDRLRVVIAYPDVTEVRMLEGDRGWRGDAQHQEPVQGVSHTSMVYQLLRTTVPWSLLQYRARLEAGGMRAEKGGPVRVLRLPWSPDLAVDFLVDEGTRRVVRVEGTLSVGAQAMKFATSYSDFRVVEGVLVPHVEEGFAGGRQTGSARLTRIRFSGDLGPFAPGDISP